ATVAPKYDSQPVDEFRRWLRLRTITLWILLTTALVSGALFGGVIKRLTLDRRVAAVELSAPMAVDHRTTSIAAKPSKENKAAARSNVAELTVADTNVDSSTFYDVRVKATPRFARITIDGKRIGRGQIHRSFARDTTRHILIISAPGYHRKRIEFVDRAIDLQISLRRRKTTARHPPPVKRKPETGTNNAAILP
ncbi:MAG: hypothetical protein AAFV29_26920, partial [Myxococcota bacterium]